MGGKASSKLFRNIVVEGALGLQLQVGCGTEQRWGENPPPGSKEKKP